MKRYSIIQDDLNRCYKCGTTRNIHVHHIYGGANRTHSEKLHFIVGLCAKHHNMSDKGVHFDKNFDLELKVLGQRKWLGAGLTKQHFIDIFGKWWSIEQERAFDPFE